MTGLLDQPRRVLWFQLLTLSRFFLAIGFAFLLPAARETRSIFWLCLGILAVAELTDLVDGVIARRFGLVSELGAMLDAYVDSLTRLTVYWALARSGLVLGFVPLVMALRDVSVAYCRIVLARHGRSVSAHLSGKIKAQTQVTGAFLALIGPLYWGSTGTWTVPAISWIVIVFTVGSLVEYAVAALKASRAN